MMIDFNIINNQNKINSLTHPRDIFMSLPNKNGKYEYPRDVQTEVWNKWYERRDNKNNVIKMNTGSGKTVTSLMILKSCLNENKGKTIYVVPDSYLVKQVIQEAKELGIAVTEDNRDFNFLNGNSILVINIYDLVNGKSVYGLRKNTDNIPIDNILIDDVHACINVIEAQFKVEISIKSEIYNMIYNILKEDIEKIYPIKSIEWENGVNQNLLIPYFVWQEKYKDIYEVLLKNQEQSEELMFKLPLIKDEFSLCNCVVSEKMVEISPKIIPIEVIKMFELAKRRIFITATIADDSILTSHFGINSDDVDTIIVPEQANDIGERFILFPQQLNKEITSDQVRDEIKKYSEKYNVVVLVPSIERAKLWKKYTDNIITIGNLEQEVGRLKTQSNGLSVFVNKYDGVDLPDDSCRILVIDDIPKISGLYENILSEYINKNDRTLDRKIQIIEQGMGRGTRSSKDYCAIILMGQELVRTLYQNNYIKKMNEATQAQIELSNQIGNQLKNKDLIEIVGSIDYCLTRNEDWKTQSKIILIESKYKNDVNISEFTKVNYKSYKFAQKRNYRKAINELEKYFNKNQEQFSNEYKGFIKYLIAEYCYFIDKEESKKILKMASSYNSKYGEFCMYFKNEDLKYIENQANGIIKKLKNFSEYKKTCNDVIENLNYQNSYNSFENYIEKIGMLLGFQSERPDKEHKGGPDNLWIDNGISVAIECKNEVSDNSEICKKDASQLNNSCIWVEQNCRSTKIVPIMIHKTNILASSATLNEDTRIIIPECLEKLKNALKKFMIELENEDIELASVSRLLKKHKLNLDNFIENYTIKPQKNK